jgi:hypothetical protein
MSNDQTKLEALLKAVDAFMRNETGSLFFVPEGIEP